MSADQATPAPTEEKKKLTFILKSSDGVEVSVEEDAAFQSTLLKKMVTDLRIEDADHSMLNEPLPISNVDGWTLKKIVDWCVAHRGEVYKPKEEHEDPRIVLTEQDDAYMNVTSEQLVQMLVGANYLDIQGILDIITQKIANEADGKSVEEIRQLYGFENDFDAEEEEELRKRFEWVEA